MDVLVGYELEFPYPLPESEGEDPVVRAEREIVDAGAPHLSYVCLDDSCDVSDPTEWLPLEVVTDPVAWPEPATSVFRWYAGYVRSIDPPIGPNCGVHVNLSLGNVEPGPLRQIALMGLKSVTDAMLGTGSRKDTSFYRDLDEYVDRVLEPYRLAGRPFRISTAFSVGFSSASRARRW